MKFQIVETTVYEVDAESQPEAEALFLAHGPGECEAPVQFIGVTQRVIGAEELHAV